MRLNRLQHIGVVLSVVWALGAGIYERNSYVETTKSYISLSYGNCMDYERDKQNGNPSRCSDESTKRYMNLPNEGWNIVAFNSLAPIPIGWFIAFMVIRVYRWIKAAPV